MTVYRPKVRDHLLFIFLDVLFILGIIYEEKFYLIILFIICLIILIIVHLLTFIGKIIIDNDFIIIRRAVKISKVNGNKKFYMYKSIKIYYDQMIDIEKFELDLLECSRFLIDITTSSNYIYSFDIHDYSKKNRTYIYSFIESIVKKNKGEL